MLVLAGPRVLGLRTKWGWVAIRGPRASTVRQPSYPSGLCILAALVWACSCFCLFKLLPWKPTNSVQFSLWNKCWTWSANHTCHLFLDHISKAQVRPLLMTITEKLRNQVKVFLSYDLKTMNTYCWLYQQIGTCFEMVLYSWPWLDYMSITHAIFRLVSIYQIVY